MHRPLVLAALSITLACDHGGADKADAKPSDAAKPSKVDPSPVAAPDAGPAPALFEGEDGSYGYKSADGEVVIPAQYMMAWEFNGNVAAVCGSDGPCRFIDRSGNAVASVFMFDNGPDEFVEDRARIYTGTAANGDEKFGFIAPSGELVIAPEWSFALPFSDGLAAVCEGCKLESDGEHRRYVGGKWGYVDLDGKVAIEPRFESAEPFADGKASVVLDGKPLVIGKDGQPAG